jgi:hypothetical protein
MRVVRFMRRVRMVGGVRVVIDVQELARAFLQYECI